MGEVLLCERLETTSDRKQRSHTSQLQYTERGGILCVRDVTGRPVSPCEEATLQVI